MGLRDKKTKTDQQKYLEQIDAYYSRRLSSHEIVKLGMTPKILQEFGAPDLPLVMQQSTVTKCVRKSTGSRSAHELSRDIIEKLPEQINNPVFLIKDEERNSIVLISDERDIHDNNTLIAIRLNEKRKNVQVNEVKSVYGKTSLKKYLVKNIESKQLHVIDNKKAEKLSRVLGLQLPTTLITSSRKHNISSRPEDVNSHFQKESVRKTSRHIRQ